MKAGKVRRWSLIKDCLAPVFRYINDREPVAGFWKRMFFLLIGRGTVFAS